MIINVKKLAEDAIIPEYQTAGAAGFDFHALEDIDIYPGNTVLIRTGLAFEIPEGYELQVIPRSGVSLKTKLRVANSPGCIDSDYRGEVCIIVENISRHDSRIPHTVRKHERIAQGKIVPIVRADFKQVNELSITKRGEGGFGSTKS